MKPKPVKIKKIHAAKEQIETAIRLFFDGGSVVSVHTLASAAFTILRDISKKNDGEFAFEVNVSIKPEYRKYFWDKVNGSANFFKHADKDPDPNSEVTFNEMTNELKIILCCQGYKEIAGDVSPVMNAFRNWMLTFYPQIFNLTEEQKKNLSRSASEI